MRIHTQIILFYVAGLSLLVAVAAYSNHAGRRLLLEEAGRQSRDMAVQLMHQIGRELDVQINYMTAVLHDGKLEAFLAESNSYFAGLNARDACIARQEKIWRGATSGQSIDTPFSTTLRSRFALLGKTSLGAQRYADIFLTNRYGVVVAQTGALSAYCHADDAWWRRAKKDGVVIEGIPYAEGAKSHGLVMALRIDDPKGNFAGVIRAEVPIVSILRDARMTPKRYETTEIEIFTRRGMRLYSTVAGEAFADVSAMPFFKKLSGQNGHFRDPTAHPGQMIAFASSAGIESFRGLEWVLALEHDEAELLAQSHLLGKKIFYGVAICALLALAAAGLMIKRIIKPVRQLRDAIRAVADGDLKKQIKVKGRDEMAQLARGFNRMTSVLDVSYMQLKQRNAACRFAQVQLRENEQRLFQFLEAMPVGVYIADHTGALYFVNQAARDMLGEGIVGQTGSDPLAHLFVAGTDEPYPKEQMPINQALGGQSAAVDDMEIHHPGGRTIPVMIWASPVFDARGKIIYATAAFSDMSEQREAENRLKATARELKRSNAELEQFAYIASHDLQEPLRKVGSYMELVAERYQDQLDQDGREFIDYAVDGARRMKVMINDLLAYSRVGTKGKPFAPTDTMKVLQDVLNDLELTIRDNDARIMFDALPVVTADESQLQQLLRNLIGNAIKYRGQEPPQIHVSAQRRKGAWRFGVQDNGIGMEARFFERIFHIFQRLHGPGRYDGTGIGLAICKKIVERHGGKIEVESTPGQGSTFYFTISD
jgi:PAS domain S-box-containing protein